MRPVRLHLQREKRRGAFRAHFFQMLRQRQALRSAPLAPRRHSVTFISVFHVDLLSAGS